uniref:Uncharacterized protein n=1 Tax=Cacopsylla melanoneura TaxID=428564 RepID=A0A8D8TJ12_9HEMI
MHQILQECQAIRLITLSTVPTMHTQDIMKSQLGDTDHHDYNHSTLGRQNLTVLMLSILLRNHTEISFPEVEVFTLLEVALIRHLTLHAAIVYTLPDTNLVLLDPSPDISPDTSRRKFQLLDGTVGCQKLIVENLCIRLKDIHVTKET